jgi:hypothetical protein
MPKTEIEILRTVNVRREESITVTVDAPQYVLDDVDELHDWAEKQLENRDSELAKACENNWDVQDEDESVEIDEVLDHGPAD